MRLLLIAHEFPPVGSPQSLRWAYLARELVFAGHQVRVLTVDGHASRTGLPALPDELEVVRIAPGSLMGVVTRVMQWRGRLSTSAQGGQGALDQVEGEAVGVVESRLNWKGRTMAWMTDRISRRVFPDERGLWFQPACNQLLELLESYQPDVVVSSHEPATCVQLGLVARKRGWRWVADLGDPVLADYTPSRWQRQSLALERQCYAQAHLVTVTSERTAELLHQRHARAVSQRARIAVVTQGFDDRASSMEVEAPVYDAERLELLYTGSFYSFRRPDLIVEAVARVPGLRLSIACPQVPAWLRERAGDGSGSIRLLGHLGHLSALAAQRGADVLVNIANENAVQIPGKFYEYLGASRPILHLAGTGGTDEAADFIDRHSLGWVHRGTEVDSLCGVLERLVREKSANGDVLPQVGREDAVRAHGWSVLAAKLLREIEAVAA